MHECQLKNDFFSKNISVQVTRTHSKQAIYMEPINQGADVCFASISPVLQSAVHNRRMENL